jgi:uncharacterized protein with HEPN domain
MQPKTPGLLWDIQDAAQFILGATAGGDVESYQQDRVVRLAVERSFEIIGEAARRLTGLDPEVVARLTGIPRIIAFRNVLAHGYDEVDDEKVWEIIQTFLPVLLSEVQALLDEVGK